MMTAWTDGACKDNPGIGGYAAYIKYGTSEYAVCGSSPFTTNNRMELEGFIAALTSARNLGVNSILIYTDSKYIENAINCGWLKKWVVKFYKDIKNPDLWSSVYSLIKDMDVTVKWVKGHSTCEENAIADKLATQARDGFYGKYSVIYF